VEGAGQLDDVSGQASLAGLQHPAFGFEHTGEIEVGELVERALGLDEARLDLTGVGAQRGDRGLAGRGRGRAGIAHEGLARHGVQGCAPGREKSFGLPGAKPMAHDRVGQALLLAVREAGQGGRGRAREPTLVEVARQLGGEAPAERQAPVHPASPMIQQLGDLRGREMIVVRERADHARLVHRARGASGGVGLQHSGLAHDTAAGVLLHDHGDVGLPLAAPAGQALEAIEDLVGAVPGRSHPQGQRGQRSCAIRARSSEGSERGGQPIEGEVDDEAHGRRSGSGSSWERGERYATRP